jgi:hypothetical protein
MVLIYKDRMKGRTMINKCVTNKQKRKVGMGKEIKRIKKQMTKKKGIQDRVN